MIQKALYMIFKTFKPDVYNSSDKSGILDALNKDGYAVISIKSINLEFLKDLYAQDLSKVMDKDLSFPDLWRPCVETPQPNHYGLGGEYGVSQGNAAWHVRTNKDIINVFSNILGSNDIVCSMDAVGFSQDTETPDNLKDSVWLHVDQNPNVSPGCNFNSFQSIFYAESSFGERSSTVVVPGSHKDWNTHVYTNKRSHFQVISNPEYIAQAVKLDIDAGCLLVFSSKLVHQGYYGPHRLCFMISYGLKSDRTEEHRKRKVMLYLSGHRSNHWSQFGHYHGWKNRNLSLNVLQPELVRGLSLSNLTEEIESLKDVPLADFNWYEEWYDDHVPAERLKLL